jgi:hypothetical protein
LASKTAKASTSHAFPDRAPNQSYGRHDRFPASVLVVPPPPASSHRVDVLASLAPRSRSFILHVAFLIDDDDDDDDDPDESLTGGVRAGSDFIILNTAEASICFRLLYV